MEENRNMALWELVHNTPPQYTKGFKRGGGFAGTAIDPTYLVMRATELWGPIGLDWGYEVVEERYVEGEPILHYPETGPVQVLGHITVHIIRLRLTYPVFGGTEQPAAIGHIEQFGQTTFIGRDKNGLFTDEEAPKKSLTDALSKCLSLLGFGADVRIGKFEDSVYAQLRDAEPTEPPAGKISKDQLAKIGEMLKAMKRDWAALAPICSNTMGREIKEMADLTEPEAVKVIAFLQGKVQK